MLCKFKKIVFPFNKAFNVTKAVGQKELITNSKRQKINCTFRAFSCSAIHLNSEKVKFLSRPRPIIAFNNWVYGNLVRGYFEKGFFLEDFCNSCPIVVEQIISCLKNSETEVLKDAINPACLENIISNWNLLSNKDQNTLTQLSVKDIKYCYPTIRMRLPGKIDPSSEIQAFLNIHIQIYYFANEKLEVNFSNISFNLPVFHNFVFEWEITKGVENTSWILESCGSFPNNPSEFDLD